MSKAASLRTLIRTCLNKWGSTYMGVLLFAAAWAQTLLLVLWSNRVLPLSFLVLILLDFRHALRNGNISGALAGTGALVKHLPSPHLRSIINAIIIIGFRLNPLRPENFIGGDEVLAAPKWVRIEIWRGEKLRIIAVGLTGVIIDRFRRWNNLRRRPSSRILFGEFSARFQASPSRIFLYILIK